MRRMLDWGDNADWLTYFKQTYLKKFQRNGEHFWLATWWYGVSTTSHHGHGPWQAPVERSHHSLKFATSASVYTSMPVLLTKLREAAATWGSPPQAKEKSFSRIADRSQAACVLKTLRESPSARMMKGEGMTCRTPLSGHETMRLLPAERFVEAARRPNGAQTMFVEKSTKSVAYVLRFKEPGTVDRSVAMQMCAQMRAKTFRGLEKLWREHGLIHQPAEDEAEQINWQGLNDMWGTYAMVLVSQHDGIEDESYKCTCVVFCEEGMCQHCLAVAEMRRASTRLGERLNPKHVSPKKDGSRALLDVGNGNRTKKPIDNN
eukprot:3295349-Amphidinium_carterae.1